MSECYLATSQRAIVRETITPCWTDTPVPSLLMLLLNQGLVCALHISVLEPSEQNSKSNATDKSVRPTQVKSAAMVSPTRNQRRV